MAEMYLSNENVTCPKEQIMHKYLSLDLTSLIPLYKLFYKPDLNSTENSVDPDQRAYESQLIWIHTAVHTVCHCELIIINKSMKYKITLNFFILVPGQVNRSWYLKLVTCPELNGTHSDK